MDGCVAEPVVVAEAVAGAEAEAVAEAVAVAEAGCGCGWTPIGQKKSKKDKKWSKLDFRRAF